MSRYIPYDKMKQLREAAKNGDEMAKKILRAQLSDDQDFTTDLDEYFKPAPEPEEVPEKQPEMAEVQENPVNAPKNVPLITGEEAPQSEISQKILDLITACDKSTTEIATNAELSEATKKGALSILGEIKQSCIDNLEKFGKLMSSITPKKEEIE